MERDTQSKGTSKAGLWRTTKYACLSLIVVFGLASIIATGGGGGGGGGGGSALPAGGGKPELFPTHDEILTEATEINTIVDEDGYEIQIAGLQVIAKFTDTAALSHYYQLESFLQQKGAEIIGQIPDFREAQIQAAHKDQIISLIFELEELPYIKEAYPNKILSDYSIHVPVSDDEVFKGDKWIDYIGVQKVWELGFHGNKNVKIGIVDGGIGQMEAYFGDQIPKKVSGGIYSEDNHGTTLATLAAADSELIVGVCPDCQIISYDDNPNPLISKAEDKSVFWKTKLGIKKCAREGAQVINVACGADEKLLDDAKWLKEQRENRWHLRDAIVEAWLEGSLVVMSAGNKPRQVEDDLLFPEDEDDIFGKENHQKIWDSNVIIVSGTDEYRGECLLLRYVQGDVVNLAAPAFLGMPLAKCDVAKVDECNGGTSHAAALVSGAAALILSLNQNLSALKVKEILTGTGDEVITIDPGTGKYVPVQGFKALNAFNAVIDEAVGITREGDSYESDNSFRAATRLTIPTYPLIGKQAHTIEPAGDQDRYAFWANAGETYTFYSSECKTWLVGELLDSTHQVLIRDEGIARDFLIDWEAPSKGTYYFRVFGYYPDSSGSYNFHFVNQVPTPEAPTNLQGEHISGGRIRLTWEDNSDNEQGFEIYRWVTMDPLDPDFDSIGRVGPNITTFIDEKPIPLWDDPNYCAYHVRAFAGPFYSERSNIAYIELQGLLLISDDFEDGDVSDWRNYNGATFSATTTYKASGNYSGSHTTGLYYDDRKYAPTYQYFAPQTGSFIVEFDFMSPDEGGPYNWKYMTITDMEPNGYYSGYPNNSFLVGISCGNPAGGGTGDWDEHGIYYSSNATWYYAKVQFEDYEWKHFRFDIDVSSQMYTLYIDSSLIATNIPFYRSASNLSYFHISSESSTCYVDNIKIYKEGPIVNTSPTVSIVTPTGTQSGNVPISYTLRDNESDTCSIQVQYSEDGGLTFHAATQGPGGDGPTNLNSSPTGISHVYVWDSLADIGQTDQSDIRLRMTPFDSREGTSDTTEDFRVDNTQQAPVLSSPDSINNGGFVRVEWTEVNGATGYHLQESLSPIFDTIKYEFETPSAYTYGWFYYPHLAPNTYYYRVRALSQEVWSNTAWVDVVTSPEPTIDTFCTCKDYTHCVPTSDFSVNDEWVYVCTWWDGVEETTTKQTLIVKFWNPNHTYSYVAFAYLQPPNPGFCVGLSIDQDPPNDSYYKNPGIPKEDPGEWDYDIYINDTLVRSDSFYLQ
jgi:hypothetical protein